MFDIQNTSYTNVKIQIASQYPRKEWNLFCHFGLV